MRWLHKWSCALLRVLRSYCCLIFHVFGDFMCLSIVYVSGFTCLTLLSCISKATYCAISILRLRLLISGSCFVIFFYCLPFLFYVVSCLWRRGWGGCVKVCRYLERYSCRSPVTSMRLHPCVWHLARLP